MTRNILQNYQSVWVWLCAAVALRRGPAPGSLFGTHNTRAKLLLLSEPSRDAHRLGMPIDCISCVAFSRGHASPAASREPSCAAQGHVPRLPHVVLSLLDTMRRGCRLVQLLVIGARAHRARGPITAVCRTRESSTCCCLGVDATAPASFTEVGMSWQEPCLNP